MPAFTVGLLGAQGTAAGSQRAQGCSPPLEGSSSVISDGSQDTGAMPALAAAAMQHAGPGLHAYKLVLYYGNGVAAKGEIMREEGMEKSSAQGSVKISHSRSF